MWECLCVRAAKFVAQRTDSADIRVRTLHTDAGWTNCYSNVSRDANARRDAHTLGVFLNLCEQKNCPRSDGGNFFVSYLLGLILMLLGLMRSDLGMTMVSKPFSNFASALSASKSSGNWTTRWNEPKTRSWRR